MRYETHYYQNPLKDLNYSFTTRNSKKWMLLLWSCCLINSWMISSWFQKLIRWTTNILILFLFILGFLLNLVSHGTPPMIWIHLTHHLLLIQHRLVTLSIIHLMRFQIVVTLWSHLTHMFLIPLSLHYLAFFHLYLWYHL